MASDGDVTPAPGPAWTVGFLGLGNMGRPMAANVAAAGFDLLCHDVAGTTERLPEGARAAASAEEVFTGADLVLLSLPAGAATLSVVDAVVSVPRPERRTAAVVDLSTVGPAVAVEAAGKLAGVGVAYADGPVSGGAAGARAGTVSLMFGGPVELLEAHRPVLAAISSNVFHVGPNPGQGQAMKLVNNFLSAMALAASSEALSFGAAHGLDLELMLDVLNVSTGRNSATVDKFPNRIITGAYDAGFHTSLMTKDVRLLAQEATAASTHRSLIEAALAVWAAADDALPGSDFTQIWQHVSGRL